MKDTAKRLFSLILAMTMICTLLPVHALASERNGEETTRTASAVMTYINPLYADVITEADLTVPSDTMLLDDADYSAGIQESGAILREAMEARQATVQVGYNSSEWEFDEATDENGDIVYVYNGTAYLDIFEAAMSHTGVPTEGDYLRFQYGGFALRLGAASDPEGNGYNYTFIYTITYYTTAAQEATVSSEVDRLLSQLAVSSMTSDYDKVKAVYDYICANIAYDYDNLYDDSHLLKYTAYAALVNKTAVCQGYANLLYRLALEMGIDCRIVAGIGNGGNHSWNIVKLDELYYNADSTWDRSCYEAEIPYAYFLRSEANFGDHTRSSDFNGMNYTSDAFYAAYPMSETDYDTGADPDPAPDPDEIGGTTGSVNWKMDEETGTLTIYGSGEIPNYANYTAQPWNEYLAEITTVVIEEGITDIGMRAFYGHTNLTSVSMPEGLLTVDAETFQGCTALTELHFPDTVTEISAYAMKDCTGLTTVTLPAGITAIDSFTFSGCTSLTGMIIPDEVTVIRNSAFSGCTALTEITIPASVTEIAMLAFADSGLNTIHFLGDPPEMVDHTSYGSFLNATASAYYPADNAAWTSDVTLDYGGNIGWGPEGSDVDPRPEPDPDDNAVTGTLTAYVEWSFSPNTGILSIWGNGPMPNLSNSTSQPWYAYISQITGIEILEGVTAVGQYIFEGHSKATYITLPDGLLTVGANAFKDCDAIKELHFPDTVTDISAYAMEGCSALETVTLPDGITAIYAFTFKDCVRLNSVEIPDKVTKIMNSVFEGCTALTEITIPASVESIGNNAFTDSGLTSVTFLGDAPEMLEHSTYGPFVGVTATAYYPADNSTWTSDVLQNYGGTITWVANGEGGDTEVTYPVTGTCGENLTWTLDEAGTLRISGTGAVSPVAVLPWYEYVDKIEAVVYEDGVTDIYGLMMPAHTNVKSITLPGNLTSLGTGAFMDCSSLTDIELPETLTSIGESAFAMCASLTEIVIPASVTEIGDMAFAACTGLTSITFEGDAPEMGGEYIFDGAATTVYYPADNATWTSDVLQNYGGTITWEETAPPVTYNYGQTAQIRLIEPWGLKANVRVYTAGMSSTESISYEELYDYGVYFIRASELDKAGLTQSTISVEDMINDSDVLHKTKGNGVEVSGNVLTATYDEGLYTYEFSDSVFVLFYVVTEEGAEPSYAPIRERNLKELVNTRKDDTSGNFTDLEKAVYAYMAQLEADITAYRAGFENPGVSPAQKAPTLADYELGEAAESSKYSFGHTVQIRLIEPWGMKVNTRVYTSGMGSEEHIDYSTLDEYGVVVLFDNDNAYTTAEELLAAEDAYVFSSANGDATVSDNVITAIYNKAIFTYQLDTNAYVMFYVKDADGYHYGPVKGRNLYELLYARKDDTSGNFGETEKAVYADMVNLYNAITAYREDYFKKN